MPETIKIAVSKLTNLFYSSSEDEQAAFGRVIAFHEPIASLLALQAPGTLLVGGSDVFWLTREPGKAFFELIHAPSAERGDRVENGRALDMIEGLGCDDLDDVAEQLQAMLIQPVFEDGGELVLPVWMDKPAAPTDTEDAAACFDVDAHESFGYLPMADCDPRTKELGAGWVKIGLNYWISDNAPNAPTVHLHNDNDLRNYVANAQSQKPAKSRALCI